MNQWEPLDLPQDFPASQQIEIFQSTLLLKYSYMYNIYKKMLIKKKKTVQIRFYLSSSAS